MADGPTDGQAFRWKYDGVSCNMKRILAQLWGAWIYGTGGKETGERKRIGRSRRRSNRRSKIRESEDKRNAKNEGAMGK